MRELRNNNRLKYLIEWANMNEVSLANADINQRHMKIEFHHIHENKENFRKLKYSMPGGKFEPSGDPPYVRLVQDIKVHNYGNGESIDEITDTWHVEWKGAYDCEINRTYNCVAATFDEDEDDKLIEPMKGVVNL